MAGGGEDRRSIVNNVLQIHEIAGAVFIAHLSPPKFC